jgi:hypothetical protein
MAWIRRTGCLFPTRAREKDIVVPRGRNYLADEPFLPPPIDDEHPCKSMLCPRYLPGFPQDTPEPLIFCSQEEALTYDPPITPSSRLFSMQGQDISLSKNRRSSEIGTARGTRYSALQEGALTLALANERARQVLFWNGCPIAQQLWVRGQDRRRVGQGA